MNRKQITILLITVVVLGAAGLVVYNKQNAGTKDADPSLGKKLLPNLPVNDVAHIAIKQATNELNLVKKEDLWRVSERNGYPANYSEISDLLLKLRDLKIAQSEKVGVSQLPRLSLVPGQGSNAAVIVDFKGQNEKQLASLALGKKHMRKSNRSSPMGDMEGFGGDEGWPDGRYVKVGSGDTVALVSDALSNMEPKPEQWLNKDFFKVEKTRSIAVTFPNATNSWKVARESETGEWKLADPKPGEQLDTGKVSGFSSALSSPSFSDVATSAKPEELGLDKPTLVNIDTFEGFAYALKVGTKTNDNYPLIVSVSGEFPKERTPGKDEKPEDKTKLDKEFAEKTKKLDEKLSTEKAYGNWTYLVSSWTLDSVLKERSQLLQEKKEEKKEEPKKDAATAASAPEAPMPPAPPTPAAEAKTADAK